MNIDDFENYIDDTILYRGEDYFSSGAVGKVQSIGENDYKATVRGTCTYIVEVELDEDNSIISSYCDCPYDMGEHCKHKVAVFYTLRDMLSDKTKQISPKPAKETIYEKISRILSNHPKEALIAFLANVAEEYNEIAQKIELEFSSFDAQKEIKICQSLIQSHIDKNSDRDGFISYSRAGDAMEGANIVIERADEALENGELERAMTIYLCVLHEIVPAIQYADDSGGDIGGVIEEALSGITNIVDSEEPAKYMDSIFNTLIKESKNSIYDGWTDWQLSILRACTEICNTTERRKILEQTFDSLIKSEKDSYSSKYLTENVSMMKRSLILKFDGEQAAKAFITDNINLPKFREIAINDAISKNDYKFAEEIALQGEPLDESLPGLVKRWKEFRIKIYELSGDIEKLQTLCMDFILDGSMDYYRKLKSTFPENEWQINYPKIIAILEATKKGYVRNYTDILIEEKEFVKLLEYVKKNPRQVESYYKHLIADFRQDIIQIFVQNIIKEAESASDRKAYQTVCAKLKLLANIGGNNEALGLRYDFLEKYKKRPAMKDELMKMKLL